MLTSARLFSRRAALWAAALVAAALIALPWVRDREHVTIDDDLRQRMRAQGHAFARLEAGTLHYELGGPSGAPLVVLIHGVSGPMAVWDETVGPLREAGFRTLRVDHFGRGWSDRVDRDYDLDLFVGEVEQILADLGESGAVRLAGSSMGAIVAAELALRHADRVDRVALIGPAGFPLKATPLARLIQVPLVGDYIMRVAGDGSLADHNRRYFHEPERFQAFQRQFEEQLTVIGSKAAILSTMRSTPVQSYLDRYADLGRLGKPLLIVWGREDRAFPYEHHEQALVAMPSAELVTVDAAGHLPMLERPEKVSSRLVEFMSRSTRR